ncbi:MAG: recombinase family protein, partial [Clostridiales bacterium]
MIYTLYTHGELNAQGCLQRLGPSLITRKLNDLQIPSPQNKDWTASTVRDILNNPVYIGKIRWNWRPTNKKIIDGEICKSRPRSNPEDTMIVNGKHQPIIDNKTWDKSQNLIKVKNPLPLGHQR